VGRKEIKKNGDRSGTSQEKLAVLMRGGSLGVAGAHQRPTLIGKSGPEKLARSDVEKTVLGEPTSGVEERRPGGCGAA